MFTDDLRLPGMLVQIGQRFRVIQLQGSSHAAPGQGVCVMEAVSSLWPGQHHTDRPKCVSNALMDLGISLNDSFSETNNRQILWKFVPKFMGTDKDGLDTERAVIGYRWLKANSGWTAEQIYDDYGLSDDAASLSIESVCGAIGEYLCGLSEGSDRVRQIDEALTALMPHEPPSLAKLEWENLQSVYGQEFDPTSSEIDAYRHAGLAVAL